MAGSIRALRAVLTAVALAVWRDLRSLNSVVTNNFFLFCFLLQKSGMFLQVILGLILLFPLTEDPLRKIPSERLGLWPISVGQRALLRIASIWLSPATWITVGLLLWAARPSLSFRFFVLAVAFHVAGLVFTFLPGKVPSANLFRRIPRVPGLLGGLVQKNIREMLTVLDVYVALVLSIAGMVYRIAGRAPDPDTFFGLALVVVLALSSYAQCLFGLESAAGFTRYSLFPLRGWQILLAKDIGFLSVAFLLTVGLSPSAGLAAGLIAVAIGHYPSVEIRAVQVRWRFTGSPSIGVSIVQVIAMFGAGSAAFRVSVWLLGPCLAVYAASLWYYGRELERAAWSD